MSVAVLSAVCPHCGASYEPKRGNHRYCSKSCLSRANVERQSRERHERWLAIPDRVCAYAPCGQSFKPSPNKHDQRFCSRQCGVLQRRDAGYLAPKRAMPQMVPDRIRRKETTTITTTDYGSVKMRYESHKGHFTDAGFEAAYQAMRRELQAQGKPLYRQTEDRVREVSRRELEA